MSFWRIYCTHILRMDAYIIPHGFHYCLFLLPWQAFSDPHQNVVCKGEPTSGWPEFDKAALSRRDSLEGLQCVDQLITDEALSDQLMQQWYRNVQRPVNSLAEGSSILCRQVALPNHLFSAYVYSHILNLRIQLIPRQNYRYHLKNIFFFCFIL